MPLSEHVYCVAIASKITERVEQWICIKFCVKRGHSSSETSQMIQRATAMGNWWLAASSQHACSGITSYAEFSVKHQITQVTQPHRSPDLVPCDFWLFPKLESPLNGKGSQTINWDLGKHDRTADGNWENCVRSQGDYFEGDWGVIVLCTMFLVSCIFFSKCLYFSHYMAGDLLDITCMCLRIYTSILWLIYTSLMVSSDEQKFLIFMKSSLSIFYFIICIIGVFPKDTKILP